MNEPFHIMIKPVCGVCNLDCRYCYYSYKPKELYPGVEKFQMDDATLESLTRQYLQAMPQRCEFGWQGGEPLLAGKDFFRRAVELQKQYRVSDTQQIANALQTNATLLDDEWCEFLAENKFLVGVSTDGPPQVHDKFRLDHAGKGSWHRAWHGLELLQKHGVEFNVLVTLNRASTQLAGDLYRYFVNRGIHYLQFIPVLEREADGTPADFCLTPEQFGHFLLQTYQQWAQRDIGRVSERFIDNVLHTLIFGEASMCCHAKRCANAHVVEFNGDLYACDHFVHAEWKIGNLTETPLEELRRSPRLDDFAELKTTLPDVCKECEYLWLCNGGCPKHHFPIGTDPARKNYFCESYKMFFREALPELRKIAEVIKANQNRAPAAPPPNAKPPVPVAGRPGRNDPCPCGSGRKFKSCCGRK